MIASIIATRKLVIGKIVISLSVTAGPVAFILVLDWPIFHHGIVESGSARGRHPRRGKRPLCEGGRPRGDPRQSGHLKPRIDGLALQRQDAEDTVVSKPRRLPADKALQRLNSQGELPTGERTLHPNVPRAQPFKVFGQKVLGSIDDAESSGMTVNPGS